jgi:glutamine synthetase
MKPDLSTMRPVPWLEGTAMVLCDLLDHHTHEPVPHAPRQILKRRSPGSRSWASRDDGDRAGVLPVREELSTICKSGYRDLTPISGYNEDYHILQTTKEEASCARSAIISSRRASRSKTPRARPRPARKSSTSAMPKRSIAPTITRSPSMRSRKSPGQHGRGDLPAEVASDKVGSSAHVHMSLWKDGKSRPSTTKMAKLGMSELMRHFMAGLIEYAPDYTWFLAPYVNSYKRFMKGTFAPTRTVWSVDNRTAGFRLCGEGTKAVRVECRIGGSDMNPYLAQAALLAAGIKGIEDKLELAPPTAATSMKTRSQAHPLHLAGSDGNPARLRRCCARRWAMRWLTTMCAAPSGSRKNSTRR